MANLTVLEFLRDHMGPQAIAPEIAIPITVTYIIIFVTGVVGNIVVCLVVARDSHFQTPTNFYLFSLAISDLLILIFGLPNDLKVYWQQYPWELGEAVCKLRALVAETTSYASVLTIVAFSMERYVAVCRPLLLHAVSSLPRTVRVIVAVWVVATLAALPFALLTQVNYVQGKGGEDLRESAFCSLPIENTEVIQPLLQWATLAFFVLPLVVLVALYARIGLALRRRRPRRRSSHRMLVAVVIAFFACWAPFHAQRLLTVYVPHTKWTRLLRTLNEVLYYSGGCLYYFSATINPIFYSLLSSKYREAFRATLCHLSTTATNDSPRFRSTGRYYVSDRFPSRRGPADSTRNSPAPNGYVHLKHSSHALCNGFCGWSPPTLARNGTGPKLDDAAPQETPL